MYSTLYTLQIKNIKTANEKVLRIYVIGLSSVKNIPLKLNDTFYFSWLAIVFAVL